MTQKFLDKDTSEYLVSIGCVSESFMSWLHISEKRYFYKQRKCWVERSEGWKLVPTHKCQEGVQQFFPAFSFEDILREDNYQKIRMALNSTEILSRVNGRTMTLVETIVSIFQNHPDTWPEKIAKLIRP